MTEEAARRSVPAGRASRPMAAAAASIAAHGVVLLLVVMVILPAAPARHSVEPTPIQVVQLVEPAPVPAPAPPPLLQPIAAPSPGTLGRRGSSAPRSATRAPADPYSDLVVHYDAPASEAPGNHAGATGLGIGAGPTGDGIGDIPLPTTPTRARPARPKRDYSRWGFRAAAVFRGAIVRLELAIDATGAVRGVRIVKGVDDHIDREATSMASRFEFHPALDDDGRPVASRHGWEFVIQ